MIIIKTLLLKPDVLILDEALSNVDGHLMAKILNYLYSYRKEVIVTHKTKLVNQFYEYAIIKNRISYQNNLVKFNNDFFFKYLLSRDTLESQKLRKYIVKNPEINQNTVLAKNIILDICAVDETGRIIDIEMQMAGSSNTVLWYPTFS